MSKCPKELNSLLKILGIDPGSVEIHMIDGSDIEKMNDEPFYASPTRFFESLKNNDKSTDENAESIMHDVSDDTMKSYLSHCGFSTERIAEIMNEKEQNRKLKAEAEAAAKKSKEAVANSVVVTTLKSIAKAHGYELVEAYVKDGKPHAVVENTVGAGVADAEILFSERSYSFCVSVNGVYAGEGMDVLATAVQRATSCCKALNSIDWRSWPVISEH